MAQRNVKVGILLSARDLASVVLRRARTGLTGLRESVFSLRTAMVALATGVVARGIKSLFDLGSAAEETANKFQTVFGSATPEVQKFLNTFGVVAGLSREQGQALSSVTGQIVQGLGFARAASADFSVQVVKLAADLASFNNTSTPDALEAVNSALTGITVPLKQYGIVLRESDIQQRALVLSGKESENQLTQQEKALAAFQLITEKAGVAVGDMERTQNSTANTARRLASQISTLKSVLGEVVVEVVNITGGIGAASNAVQGFTQKLEKNRAIVSAWAVVVVRVVQFVISVFSDLIRVAFNVGQVIGDSLEFIFTELSARLRAVGQLMVGLLTKDIRQIAAGIRGTFTFDKTSERLSTFVDQTKGNFKDIGDAVNHSAQSLANLAVAIESASRLTAGLDLPASRGSVAPRDIPLPVAPARADTVTVKDSVKKLTDTADRLQKKFELGLIPVEQFVIGVGELTAAMEDLQATGKLNEDQQLALAESMNQLRTSAESFAQGVRVVDPQQVDVVERLAESLSVDLVRALGLGVSMIEELNASMLNLVDATLQGFGDAFATVLDAVATQGKISGAELARGLLLGIAKAASTEAAFYFARGVAALAASIFPFPNPQNAISAGQYFKAAALMSGVAVAAGLAARAVGGGGGGGGAAEVGGAAGATAQAAGMQNAGENDATIVVTGGLLDMSDPKQADALARALEQLSGRRVTVRAGA